MSDVRTRPSPGDGIPERIAEAVRERTALEPVAAVSTIARAPSSADRREVIEASAIPCPS